LLEWKIASSPPRSKRIVVVATFLIFTAEFAQSVLSNKRAELTPWYVSLHAVFLALYVAFVWVPNLPRGFCHFYFAIQSLIVTVILGLNPNFGAVAALFVLLTFQAASVFADRSLWIWVGIFTALTGLPMMYFLGTLTGLARALLPMMGIFILSAYITAGRELEFARLKSQAIINELTEINRQLQAYVAQVEELTVIDERNRLARELHNSVSQTIFTIVLTTRSAQILMERNPALARISLEQLHALSQSALTDMRKLISQLNPKTE